MNLGNMINPLKHAMMARELGENVLRTPKGLPVDPTSKAGQLMAMRGGGGMGGAAIGGGSMTTAADLIAPPGESADPSSAPPMGDEAPPPMDGSATPPMEGNILDGASAGLSPEAIQASLAQSAPEGAAPPLPMKGMGGDAGFTGNAMAAGLKPLQGMGAMANPLKPQDQLRGAMMNRMLNPFGWGRR